MLYVIGMRNDLVPRNWGCTGFDGTCVVAGCMSSCSHGSRKKAVGINVLVENTSYSLAA